MARWERLSRRCAAESVLTLISLKRHREPSYEYEITAIMVSAIVGKSKCIHMEGSREPVCAM